MNGKLRWAVISSSPETVSGPYDLGGRKNGRSR
jgi:hypothetical protein